MLSRILLVPLRHGMDQWSTIDVDYLNEYMLLTAKVGLSRFKVECS